MTFNDAISIKLERLKQVHDEKASEYGDTISENFGVFADLCTKDRLKCIIDMKLSRIAKGRLKEDSHIDLILYLIHLWELEFPENQHEDQQNQRNPQKIAYKMVPRH